MGLLPLSICPCKALRGENDNFIGNNHRTRIRRHFERIMAITEDEYIFRTARYIRRVENECDCEFCADYRVQRYSDRLLSQTEGLEGAKHKYSLKLVSETYKNKERRGSFTMGSYPIHFCPVCGKKIC